MLALIETATRAAADWTGIGYLWLKYIHVLSAFLLFGTGLGTAFHLWAANRSGDVRAIAVATRNTVWADWLFTTPAVIVQPLTGLMLAVKAGFPLAQGWLAWTWALYVVAGLCWLPVVWLQLRMHALSAAARDTGTDLPAAYHRMYRAWFCLGWPAFAAMLMILQLMLFKTVPGA